MDVICSDCHSLHWLEEKLKDSPMSAPAFSHCCHRGKVHLPLQNDAPEPLYTLFTSDTKQAKQFRENIRQYNSALAFTSFTAKETNEENDGGGPWVWKSGYTIYHRAGSLFPNSSVMLFTCSFTFTIPMTRWTCI
jgi:hypothetical protein